MFQANPTDPGAEGKKPEEKIDIGSILTLGKQIEVLRTNVDGIFSSLMSSYQEVERQAAMAAKAFGGTRLFSEDIKRNIAEATPSVAQLGGSLADVSKMQLSVMEQLGTQAMFNSNEFANLYGSVSAVSKAGEDIGAKTGEITRKFVDAGYSIHAVSGELLGVVNSARELGVASEVVFSQVAKNIEKIDMFHFEGGVRGMAEMAAQSALLRIDMTDTLDVARKLFKPEEAIKMAAQFQQLGVNVSELLDPMKLMDMARNAPELLQKKLGEAFSQLTRFNQETGRMEVPSGAQDFFIYLGETLGKTPEQLMQWGKSVGDLSRKMKEIKFSPDFEMNEEMKEKIASLSHLAEKGSKFEGRYIVNIGGEEVLSSELSKENIDAIKEASAPAKSGAEVAKNSLDMLRQINGVLEAQRDLLALSIVTNKNVNEDVKNALKLYMVAARGQAETLGLKPREVGGTTVYGTKGIEKTVDEDYSKLKGIMASLGKMDFEQMEKDIKSYGKEKFSQMATKIGDIPELLGRISKEEGAPEIPEEWIKGTTKLMNDLIQKGTEYYNMAKDSKFASDALHLLGVASDEVKEKFNNIKNIMFGPSSKEKESEPSKTATPSEEFKKAYEKSITEQNVTNVSQSITPQTNQSTFLTNYVEKLISPQPILSSPSKEYGTMSLSRTIETPSRVVHEHNHTVGGDINLKADSAKINDLVRYIVTDRSFLDHLQENVSKFNSDWNTLKGGK